MTLSEMGRFVALLVLWGCSLSCCSYVQLRKYYYINQNMSWGDAREYCRTHYTDLATIESDNDINGLQSGFSYEKAWIGLWDDPSSWKWSLGSDPNSWRWSSIGEPGRTSYSGFIYDDPNAQGAREYCAVMMEEGGWYDISCERNHSFVCYTASNGSGKVFHHVNTIKSWYSAQEYCRSHYTDLATIENAMENDMIFNDTQRLYFWIGLSRVPWTWSNRSPVSFTNWQTGQPDNQNSTQFCAAELSDHNWTDEDCSTRMVFICHKTMMSKTVVKMQIKASADLTDPTVNAKVLQQLRTKLTNQGLTNVVLRWRSPPTKQKKP